MPEIDTDLFQVLALALLFLTLITLLAALSTLSAIRKQLTSGVPVGTSEPTASTGASSYDYAEATPAYEPAYAAPAATTPEPTTQEATTGFVSVADAVASPAAATASTGTGLRGDEPEEQPFERDGRWWFKRGGELLVYDEGTGQWVTPPGAQSSTGAATSATETFATTTAAPVAEAGEGWKCASCGAVNGSTATSCRMCFAPR